MSWAVPAFDEAAVLIRVEGDDLVSDEPPLPNYMKAQLAANVDVEDDWYL